MTGRYLIYTPVESLPNERHFDKAWKRFAEICRSLHRDGLDYSVQLNFRAARPACAHNREWYGQTAQAIHTASRSPASTGARATVQGSSS